MDWLMPLSLERGLPGTAQEVGFPLSTLTPPHPTTREKWLLPWAQGTLFWF